VKKSKLNYTQTYLYKDHFSLLTCIVLRWWRHNTQQTPAPGTMVQVGIVPQKGQRTAQRPVTGNINYFCTSSVLDLDSSREHKMAESDQHISDPLSSWGASRNHWLGDWVGHWAGLYALENGKTSCPGLELKHDSSVDLVLISTETTHLWLHVLKEYL
jgi:hypothetical protein